MRASDLAGPGGDPYELQVWHGNQCVGLLEVRLAHKRANSVTLSGISSVDPLDELCGDDEPVNETKTYRIRQRSCALSRFDLVRESPAGIRLMLQSIGLPSFYDVFEDSQTDTIRFTWSVVAVSTEEYEDLFDNDLFHPE